MENKNKKLIIQTMLDYFNHCFKCVNIKPIFINVDEFIKDDINVLYNNNNNTFLKYNIQKLLQYIDCKKNIKTIIETTIEYIIENYKNKENYYIIIKKYAIIYFYTIKYLKKEYNTLENQSTLKTKLEMDFDNIINELEYKKL